jgi:hypothetical protein
MKNKWKWIYNPFEFVAGWKVFGIGLYNDRVDVKICVKKFKY